MIDATDAALEAALAARLGSRPVRAILRADHMSDVRGYELADGRRVVAKVRAADPRLAACFAVQQAVWDAGIGCPEPLVAPFMLTPHRPVDPRTGPARMVSVEAYAPGGTAHPDGDATHAYAVLLADLLALRLPADPHLAPGPAIPWMWFDHPAPDRTWPPPADHHWDPHRTDVPVPTEVRRAADLGRRLLLAGDGTRAARPVVAHGDLSGINVRWFGDRPLVHDWDSAVLLPRAVVVGTTAFDHLSHLATPGAGPGIGVGATPDDFSAFLDAFDHASGTPLTAAERRTAHAAALWLGSYNAAFECISRGPGALCDRVAADLAWHVAEATTGAAVEF